jgi:prefoldin subunit 4|eukprot:COSAG06_NODE_5094_length_3724_cov_1.842759_3_plen_64_part_00
MKMGECYVLLPKEDAEETLERKIEECEEQLGAMDEKVAELKETMAGLKVELYGRFGKSINLDE